MSIHGIRLNFCHFVHFACIGLCEEKHILGKKKNCCLSSKMFSFLLSCEACSFQAKASTMESSSRLIEKKFFRWNLTLFRVFYPTKSTIFLYTVKLTFFSCSRKWRYLLFWEHPTLRICSVESIANDIIEECEKEREKKMRLNCWIWMEIRWENTTR